MLAKPILDFAVGVDTQHEIDSVRELLEEAGWIYSGDLISWVGVVDVVDEGARSALVVSWTGYLWVSMTSSSVRVRRVLVDSVESWTVVDGEGVVDPAERFLAYLSATERSPNTVRAYAHDLRDLFEFSRCGALCGIGCSSKMSAGSLRGCGCRWWLARGRWGCCRRWSRRCRRRR